MNRILIVAAILALCMLFAQGSYAQVTASQTVTFAVNAISKISVSGDPGALTITTGTAGTDALTAVGDSTTTYSITHNNSGGPLKLTAQIASAMPAGLTLQLKLSSTKGTSAGYVDISNATAAVDMVTGIARGADAAQQIAYMFGALASAGDQSSSRLVTLTLTP